MLTAYMIIALITTITMICLFKWAIDQEKQETIILSDDPPEEHDEIKLSAWAIIVSIAMGAVWPAVIIAVLVVVITGLN